MDEQDGAFGVMNTSNDARSSSGRVAAGCKSFMKEQASQSLIRIPFEVNPEIMSFLAPTKGMSIVVRDLEKEIIDVWADELIRQLIFLDPQIDPIHW